MKPGSDILRSLRSGLEWLCRPAFGLSVRWPVAQISNLLYRGLPTRKPSGTSDVPPTASRRYGKLGNLRYCASGGRAGLSAVLAALLLSVLSAGCGRPNPDVVIYAAQDRVYAEPLLRQFENETGLKVGAVYDSEAVKTVGLANRLLAEREHPVADVFWGNEEFRTRQLAAKGVFAETNGWSTFGWRSRRVMINTNQISLAEAPGSLLELTNAVWRGRVALAYPLFGTTATHFAALRQHWGDEQWTAWCRGLRANNAFILDGNSVVAWMVARGEAWIGLTDSDDFKVVAGEGSPVVQLDLNADSLLIPNTVAVTRNGPNPEAARKLATFLTGPTVANALVAAGALEGVDPATAPVRGLQPDWPALLEHLEETTARLNEMFVR